MDTNKFCVDSDRQFSKIKQHLIKNKKLFIDHDFPANVKTIGNIEGFSKYRIKRIEWHRPTELSADPKFIIDGVSRFDVNQGRLGNCWMLAALTSLSLNHSLFHRVVPEHQTFQKGNYAGIFHFRFWKDGIWEDIIIDDLLPTNSKGELIFLKSTNKNEYWSALLEKAYAKLYGSYSNLDMGGISMESLNDFTGGITEIYDLTAKIDIFDKIVQSFAKESLICASILTGRDDTIVNGLVSGHAYAVTGAKYIKNNTIQLLRIRNPWGNDVEWNGLFSDYSKIWNYISKTDKARLNFKKLHDGEFWIPYLIFLEKFNMIEICNIVNYVEIHGAWVVNAPDRSHANYSKNPQIFIEIDSNFKIKIKKSINTKHFNKNVCYRPTSVNNLEFIHVKNLIKPKKTNKISKKTHKKLKVSKINAQNHSVLISLTHKNFRMNENVFAIGFCVFKLDSGTQEPLNNDYFKVNRPVERSQESVLGKRWNFTYFREISGRFYLEPGRYCIVPSIYNQDVLGEFVLRISEAQ